MENKSNVYMCYSLNLRNYLYKNGLRYEVAALNPNTNRMFWLYLNSEKLDKLLTEWSQNK